MVFFVLLRFSVPLKSTAVYGVLSKETRGLSIRCTLSWMSSQKAQFQVGGRGTRADTVQYCACTLQCQHSGICLKPAAVIVADVH